ncbi:ATP-dependent DNA ligase [Hyphopichia burtonii NRRL Y-1933]|uniref:DNA ligase 4 n=1 Tax=Hyphopichia burtonii NRRL Y-1933 TaxID=984485 RepID=A0A1E4RKE8_9ASCO|nr:ATP-dependent DNA ligase [Hyphopichia burtonii NRRL Y-1933]ODV67700.1 ATP-dependent DNA ligase [Hyphopichia burtonii NRRL Y-1933]
MSYLDSIKAPVNHNPNPVPFHLLISDLFTKINIKELPANSLANNKRDYHVNLFNNFVNHYRIQIGEDFYPVFRLILPELDSRLYHLKDVSLNRLFIKILNIPKNSPDYNLLFNWKKNYHYIKNSNGEILANLPQTFCQILSHRRTQTVPAGKLSVNDINNSLDELTKLTKSDDLVRFFNDIFDQLSIEEIRWFCHIILKDSILSNQSSLFWLTYHPDSLDLLKITNNLKLVVWACHDPLHRLSPAEKQIQLFHAFIPEALEKIKSSYDTIINRLTNKSYKPSSNLMNYYNRENYHGKFIIEEKIDGDRMLIHMINKSYPTSYNNLEFKFYSRRRKNYTLLYGSNNHFGSLLKFLSRGFSNSFMVSSCILDGEMVAFDKTLKKILPFGTLKLAAIQELVKQFNTTDAYDVQDIQPLFMIFDVLYLNSKNLTHLPLYYRKEVLKKIINPIENRFQILNYALGVNSTDINNAIKQVISERSEGVMLKNILSKYEWGKRSKNWIKVKPEYLEYYGENVDLIVIGKIKGVKNSFICALFDLDSKIFKSFCNVANGFTYDEYKEIDSISKNKWHNFKIDPPPIDLLQFGTKKPDEWLNPYDCQIILEIKARSIDHSDTLMYKAGTTLHGLWCRSLRRDLNLNDCENLQSYLAKKNVHHTNKIQKVNSNFKRKINFQDSIIEDERSGEIDFDSSENKTIFQKIKMLILTDYKSKQLKLTRNQLIELVKLHGGDPVNDLSNINLDDFKVVIIGSKLIPSIIGYINQGWDILKPVWILDCINKNSLVPLEPNFILNGNDQLTEFAGKRLDKFGDSFTTTLDSNYPIKKKKSSN